MKRLISHSQSWRCAALLVVTLLVGLGYRSAVAQPVPANPPAPQGAAGQPEPGYLGIVGDDRQENGAGIRVIEIEAGGPAAAGGLKEDDLIVAVSGKAVHSTADMGSILQPLPPGSKVSFDVERSGAKQIVSVTLGTRPAPDQRRFARFGRVPDEPLPDPNANPNGPGPATGSNAPSGLVTPNLGNPPVANPHNDALPEPPARAPRLPPSSLVTPQPGAHKQLLGVRTQPVTEEIRRRLRLLSSSGALVVSRVLGSPAEKAGIPLDAVITAFGESPVESPEDLARLVNQAGEGKSVRITYFSAGDTRRVNVVLGDAAATTPGGAPGELPPGAPPPLPEPPKAAPSAVAPLEAEPRGVPALPAPPRASGPADDHARLEALEHRVDQLEQRVRELEQALKK